MGRNLVLCFDGTNNEFGKENTSVVRLIQSLNRDPKKQRLYYDPGVGTLPEPGLALPWLKRASELFGLAFGAGLSAKVGQGYSYLMEMYEPGDKVFLFGFSRGAHAARVLAGLLHALGLMPKGNQNLIPYLLRIFKAIQKDKSKTPEQRLFDYEALCDSFRWTFARPTQSDPQQRRFPVDYLGLWDTVTSVGWVWDPVRFPYATNNPSVRCIRHAVAIDERRWFFRQNRWGKLPGQDVDERWFAGSHSDVGGGYREDQGGLWRPAFEWIVMEAKDKGLFLDDDRYQAVLHRTNPPEFPWKEDLHESLTCGWWIAEYFPKWRRGEDRRTRLAVGRGRRREIEEHSRIDKSALLRIRETEYAPPNLSVEFIKRVRALSSVPEFLEVT